MNFYTLNHDTINLIASFLKPNCAVNLKKTCKFANSLVSLFHHNILYNVSWDIILEKPRSENFLEKCMDYVDWNALCTHQKLSCQFMLKHFDKLCLDRIGEYQNVYEEIIDRIIQIKDKNIIFGRRIIRFFRYIIEYNKLDQKIINKMTEYLHEVYKIVNFPSKFDSYLDKLAKYQKLSLEFITKYNNFGWWINLLKHQKLNYKDVHHMFSNSVTTVPLIYKNIYKTEKEILEIINLHIFLIDWETIKDFEQYFNLEEEIKDIYNKKISELKSDIIPMIDQCDKNEDYISIEDKMENLGERISLLYKQKKKFEINILLAKNPNIELKTADLTYVNWDMLSVHPKLCDEKITEYNFYIIFAKLTKLRDVSHFVKSNKINIVWKIKWKTYLKQKDNFWIKYLYPRDLIKYKPLSIEKIAQFLIEESYFSPAIYNRTISESNMSTSLILEIAKNLKGYNLEKFLRYTISTQHLSEQCIAKLFFMYRKEMKEIMLSTRIYEYQRITKERLEELALLSRNNNNSGRITAFKLYYQKTVDNVRNNYPDASPIQIAKIMNKTWQAMTNQEKTKYKKEAKYLNN